MNEPSEATVCSSSFAETMDEYERCCQKNIRQHVERIEHRIEADPQVIIAMIAKIRDQDLRIAELDDQLSVTIGALRIASEKSADLANGIKSLFRSPEVWITLDEREGWNLARREVERFMERGE